MRIVLFTIEDSVFMPSLLRPIVQQRRSEIVAAFISRSIYGWRFMRRHFLFMLRNRYPFCIRTRDWRRFAASRLNAWGRPRGKHAILDALRAEGIAAEYIKEVRSEAARERLRALDADVFLFCPFDKIVGPKFLAIPRLGTYNLHLGKLPEYRGGLHAFWVLRFADQEAGTTVHRVTTELDAGDIIAERRFPVTTNNMRQLMFETMQAAGPAVLEALDRIQAGNCDPVDVCNRPVRYFMLPAREDFEAFYQRGCCLL
jgi:folate-dependent phosphoribosylglycinamide formyltransferase PurN